MSRLFSLLCAPIVSLLVPVQMVIANRRVSTIQIDLSKFEALSNSNLEKLVQSEWTRATELDEKLYRLTAALSLAVPVSGLVGSTMLQNVADSVAKTLASGLYLLALVLLAVGIALGFNGILPKKRYGYGAKYTGVVSEGGEAAKCEMVVAMREFERDNLIRSNETTAAVVSIRNAVLVFTVGTIVNLYALSAGENNALEETKAIPVEATLLKSDNNFPHSRHNF